MVVQSTVELSDEEVLHIRDAVYKHHESFLSLVYTGDVYAWKFLLSWFQTEKFNIWTTDFNGDTDDYLVEVCPRDYPNDVSSSIESFAKPTEFKYAYTTIYFEPIKVYEIKLPRDYWKFYHSDTIISYEPGYETWPRFQIYAHEGYITDVPESLLVDDPYDYEYRLR